MISDTILPTVSLRRRLVCSTHGVRGRVMQGFYFGLKHSIRIQSYMEHKQSSHNSSQPESVIFRVRFCFTRACLLHVCLEILNADRVRNCFLQAARCRNSIRFGLGFASTRARALEQIGMCFLHTATRAATAATPGLYIGMNFGFACYTQPGIALPRISLGIYFGFCYYRRLHITFNFHKDELGICVV